MSSDVSQSKSLPKHVCTSCMYKFPCFGLFTSKKEETSAVKRVCDCEQVRKLKNVKKIDNTMYFCTEKCRLDFIDQVNRLSKKDKNFSINALAASSLSMAKLIDEVDKIAELKPVPHLIVYFDFETSGFKKPIHIIQIGAKIDAHFSLAANDKYRTLQGLIRLEPGAVIEPQAAKLHGHTTEEMQSESHPEFNIVWECFLRWLDESRRGAKCEEVILVAHNCFRYDKPILYATLERWGIKHQPAWLHYSDSWVVLHEMYPSSTSCSLQHLREQWLPDATEKAHDAMGDVELLHRLIHEGLPDRFNGDSRVRARKAFYEHIIKHATPTISTAATDSDADATGSASVSSFPPPPPPPPSNSDHEVASSSPPPKKLID